MTGSESESKETIATQVERARDAQATIDAVGQSRVDELTQAVGWALYREGAARDVAAKAVSRTGVGNVDDKVFKTKRQIVGALEDMRGAPSVGTIRQREGLVDIAKPVGVIGAFLPATNPVATIPHLAMLAVKGRNAVVFSPAPGTRDACQHAVSLIRAELARADAPRDLVQVVSDRATRDNVVALAAAVDFAQATASQSVVDIVQQSGTPNHAVAVGNVVTVVDQSVEVATTATEIATSATLDHGATCVNANTAVLHRAVAEDVLTALEETGAYRCSKAERDAVTACLFDENGSVNRDLVGSDAAAIADAAGFSVSAGTDLLVVDGDDLSVPHSLFGETLSPVLTTTVVPDFETGLDVTDAILAYEGRGHSCGVYTTRDDHIRAAAERLPVGRLIVNQPSIALAGGKHNRLPFTLSLGGGSWAGNQSDGNLTYRTFLDVTTIARSTTERDCDPESVFEEYAVGETDTPFDG
ncbi:aldehyde dehydrogenase family protein [Haloarcula pellucida]|uniref:Aldehyde dehydrogenase domain-containing protein n=1 Tax=Haloarcula pellucida TaxID=1427151 RepID=A0A830GKL6_9EURY|nr:aldehyde dehydrogenase family protein [Halomicroarcula pellucida]MBX0349931.1 aldehyde dehydrogenase family protein [Halomicroarcula pellucida]GGN95053.1 hypothetical protein GCM10009030_22070 [Halomicroarcula pellucida]